MKTKARQTSIFAYRNLDDLGLRQREVYQAIKIMGIASNLDISRRFEIPINQVTPRTNELVAAGLVEIAKRDTHNITGRRVIFWKVVDK